MSVSESQIELPPPPVILTLEPGEIPEPVGAASSAPVEAESSAASSPSKKRKMSKDVQDMLSKKSKKLASIKLTDVQTKVYRKILKNNKAYLRRLLSHIPMDALTVEPAIPSPLLSSEAVEDDSHGSDSSQDEE
jgi:hypothetical protein